MTMRQLALIAATIGVFLLLAAVEIGDAPMHTETESRNEQAGRAHYASGQRLAAAEQWDEAAKQFEKALEHFPAGSGMNKACRAVLLKIDEKKAGRDK